MSQPRPGFEPRNWNTAGAGDRVGAPGRVGLKPGAWVPAKAPFEQVPALGPAVGERAPDQKPESGLLPASKDPRPGQLREHTLGWQRPGAARPALSPCSLPLDNFKELASQVDQLPEGLPAPLVRAQQWPPVLLQVWRLSGGGGQARELVMLPSW